MPDPIDLLLQDSEQVETPSVSNRFNVDSLLDYLDEMAVATQRLKPVRDFRYLTPTQKLMAKREFKRKQVFETDDISSVEIPRPDRRSVGRLFSSQPYPTNPLTLLSDNRRSKIFPQARQSVVGLTFRQPSRGPSREAVRFDKVHRKYIENPDFRLWYVDRGQVIPCIRRRRRREVLFAKRRAGIHKMRKPKWNQTSYYIC